MTLDNYMFNDEYLFNMPLSPLPKVVRSIGFNHNIIVQSPPSFGIVYCASVCYQCLP